MSRPGVPTVVTVNTASSTNVGSSATEVLLRARSSNVQAISLNVTIASEANPGGDGASAMVMFPGESIQLPVNLVGIGPLKVKYIIFDDDTALDDPVLEIVEIVP